MADIAESAASTAKNKNAMENWEDSNTPRWTGRSPKRKLLWQVLPQRVFLVQKDASIEGVAGFLSIWRGHWGWPNTDELETALNTQLNELFGVGTEEKRWVYAVHTLGVLVVCYSQHHHPPGQSRTEFTLTLSRSHHFAEDNSRQAEAGPWRSSAHTLKQRRQRGLTWQLFKPASLCN